uniref:Uncharacterized protein n=1 Tax=Moniliophthora roreri TaxID=221103 RepID=A0A0W0FAG2_MONRR
MSESIDPALKPLLSLQAVVIFPVGSLSAMFFVYARARITAKQSQPGLGLASVIMVTVGIGGDSTKESVWKLLDLGDAIYFRYLIANAVVNSLVTLLTAGRIWWVGRQAMKVVGKQYRTIIAILLESGMLYPIAIIVPLILGPSGTDVSPVNLFPITYQVAGIAPTLIIVRAQSGKAIESVDQVVSTLRYTGSGGESSRIRNASRLPHSINFGFESHKTSDAESQ